MGWIAERSTNIWCHQFLLILAVLQAVEKKKFYSASNAQVVAAFSNLKIELGLEAIRDELWMACISSCLWNGIYLDYMEKSHAKKQHKPTIITHKVLKRRSTVRNQPGDPGLQAFCIALMSSVKCVSFFSKTLNIRNRLDEWKPQILYHHIAKVEARFACPVSHYFSTTPALIVRFRL